jgi:hypothetical protein
MPDRCMLMTTNRCIPVKNALGRSAVVSCECELIMLCEIEFSVASYLVKDMGKSRLNVGLFWSNHHIKMALAEIDTDARI